MAKIPQKPIRPEGSVQSRIAGSSSGSAGKFGRITHDARRSTERQRSKRRRRDSRYGAAGANHGEILRRWLMVGLGLAGIVICSTLIWTLVRQGQTPPATTAGSGESGDEAGIPSLPATQALGVVTRMLDAGSPGELEPLLHKGAITPDVALQHLKAIRNKVPERTSPKWLGSIDPLSHPIDFVAIPQGLSQPIIVPLTPDEEEEWKIDFDAMLGHCDPPFPAWIEGNPESGTVRVAAREDTYFNGPFRDEEVWACLVLSHPEGDGSIYGYCRRDGSAFEAIQAIERRNQRASADSGRTSAMGSSFRITLSLRSVGGAVARQYRITEVVADDWVVGEQTFEQTLRERSENR